MRPPEDGAGTLRIQSMRSGVAVATNQRMSEAWNGPESVHYVDHADRHDRQLAPITDLILAAAALQPHQRVLDVGCGSGAMSLTAAASADRVFGLDISQPLVGVARERAAASGIDGRIEFVVGDAQTFPFDEGAFDVAVSQFGLMFFDDPVAAFTNLRRALRPNGRMVFACWQGLRENEWLGPVVRAVEVDAEVPDLGGLANGGGMFAFRHCEEVSDLLDSAGFREVGVAPVSPNLLIGGGGALDDTAAFLLGLGIVRGLMNRLDDEQRARAARTIRAELERHHRDGEGVRLGSGVWLVTAMA
jgi:ubiquinone/menaquinone biosynthesis C-methylase UbiE